MIDGPEAASRQLRWPDDLQPELPPDEPQPELPPEPIQPQVVVRTSSHRHKTASAHWEGSTIVVLVPSHVRRDERSRIVEHLVQRVLSRRPHLGSSDETLASRAAALADRYVHGVRPSRIRWVTNQGKRWGSCSMDSREIRLSHRLRMVPGWVLDATIVHELAHLVYPDHSPAFYELADRYPRQQEAGAFLEGYSLGLEAASEAGSR